MILLSSNDNDTYKVGVNKLFQDNANEESSFGVSYIGGGKIHKLISFMVSCAHHVFIFISIQISTLFS